MNGMVKMGNEMKRYSVIIYLENSIGLLSQMTNIFTRRHLSIWSILAVKTEIEGIHSITVVIDGMEKKVHEAVLHCEKNVDVVKAFYFEGNLVHDIFPEAYRISEEKVRELLEKREAAGRLLAGAK